MKQVRNKPKAGWIVRAIRNSPRVMAIAEWLIVVLPYPIGDKKQEVA